MVDLSEQKERGKSQVEIGQLAAGFGLISALVLFLSAISSWAFARGLIATTGFPAQLATFRSSIDCFPSMAFNYVGVFVVALILGFALESQAGTKRPIRLRVLLGLMLGILLLDLAGEIWETHSAIYRGLLLLAALATPLLVGHAYRSLAPFGQARYLIVGGMCLLAVSTYTENLYYFGLDTGLQISTRLAPEHPTAERGLAAVKSSDFPLITLRTKEKLLTTFEGSKDGDYFLYQVPPATGFMRLILQDESNYYVIENNQGTVRPIAIRKEIVTDMLFRK